MTIYYTDDELIERIKEPSKFDMNSYQVAELVQQRLDQRLTQNGYQMLRLDVAAKHLGHQLISDLMQEEGFE